MKRVLLVRLRGPMQVWGDHTYEDYRPSQRYPTRSGLTGLLAACMGVDRQDAARLSALDASFEFAVAAERDGQLAVDFHTVLNARSASGAPRKEAILSRREYLHDASFLVALESTEGATGHPITSRTRRSASLRHDQAAVDRGNPEGHALSWPPLDEIAAALCKPVFTPFLGRRSCPISEPLFAGWRDSASALAALQERMPSAVVLSESAEGSPNRARIRDVAVYGRIRQFGVRDVYIHPPKASDGQALPEQDRA